MDDGGKKKNVKIKQENVPEKSAVLRNAIKKVNKWIKNNVI